MARAVIITGIPYPSLKDAKVELKRKFVDSQGKRSFSGSDCTVNRQVEQLIKLLVVLSATEMIMVQFFYLMKSFSLPPIFPVSPCG